MTQKRRAWADQPYALLETPQFKTKETDPITLIATEMANVHNILTRGLNSIILQAPHVQSNDRKPFIGYTMTWCKFVHHHHKSEEDFFFKVLDEKFGNGVVDQPMHEHEAFHDGLERFEAYLESLKGREAEFSGEKMLELISALAPALYTHLVNEIDFLLSLKRFDDQALIVETWTKAAEQGIKGLKGRDLLEQFPFGFLCHDTTFEEGVHKDFPPVPRLMKWFIVYICGMWNWRWWRFAPCDRSGQPKELYALGDEK